MQSSQRVEQNQALEYAIERVGDPSKNILEFSEDACVVVTDVGYTRITKEWKNDVLGSINCPFVCVEANVVVPVETVSEKEEYSAATLRPKIRIKASDSSILPSPSLLNLHL